MKNKLWKFVDDKGAFTSRSAREIKTLYFPLCNSAIMSSVSSDLHGDIKACQNSFLLAPASRTDLYDARSSRNFWVSFGPGKAWSVTGVSRDAALQAADEFSLSAGLLWHRVTRSNKKLGLKAEVLSFAPSSGEPVEIMRVTIFNNSGKKASVTPFAVIPLFCRSADTIRDHRHVTSLLNRIECGPHGIIVTPTMLFNESGHRENTRSYFAIGMDESGTGPRYVYPTHDELLRDRSDFELPEAVRKLAKPLGKAGNELQGKEAAAGLRFKKRTIAPGASASYTILLGIAGGRAEVSRIRQRFDRPRKVEDALSETKKHWESISSRTEIATGDADFDNWFRWVSIQPTLRTIFGCSFLPDFDYGKGGRGWRDLWQDALALIFVNPDEVRAQLISSFSGVRLDGSNATIIGKQQGEFIADRNNISRVWMDHGAWPVLTTHFYVQQTGDLTILLENAGYFLDHERSRGRKIDAGWRSEHGGAARTAGGEAYLGTVLEHMLTQTLAQFFNVGGHNNIRLENADWNDGLDMAYENGESVAFSAMYAFCFEILAALIEKLPQDEPVFFEELSILLDRAAGTPVDYNDPHAKQARLDAYFQLTDGTISGKTRKFSKAKLRADLTAKAEWLKEHIRVSEWLREGFFNGYYDNAGKRVEGTVHGRKRMTLTGQAFPVMSGAASPEQIRSILKNVDRFLKDPATGGLRLNTDFGEPQHTLGRAFSFAYGEKENGAVFSHMAVMFAYGLSIRGFRDECWHVLATLSAMARSADRSKIYPCLPEYFNAGGRGMYAFLTGSASWYVLALVTRVFGVRGEWGDLVLDPGLPAELFGKSGRAALTCAFADRRIRVVYGFSGAGSPRKITRILFNGQELNLQKRSACVVIPRAEFLRRSTQQVNSIEVELR